MLAGLALRLLHFIVSTPAILHTYFGGRAIFVLAGMMQQQHT
jgi:hypothetical protein